MRTATFTTPLVQNARYLTVCIILLIANLFPCDAQENYYKPAKTYSIGQLKADYNYLRELLERAHPSLYRYYIKDTVDAYFNRAFNQISRPLTEMDFWKLAQPVVVKLCSGHTSLDFSIDMINDYNNSAHYFFPFHIFIRNDRIFVKDLITVGNVYIGVGDEVLSIDGVSSSQILSTLRHLISGDGYSNAFKDNQLESAFNRLFNFSYAEKSQYQFTFITDGIIKTKTVKTRKLELKAPLISSEKITITPTTFSTISILPESKPDSSLHHLKYPNDLPSTAVLKIKEFIYTDYVAFHRTVFRSLRKKKIKNLVIDIRDNKGGTSAVCKDLLSYLSERNLFFTHIDEGVINHEIFLNAFNASTTLETINLSGLDHQLFQKKYMDNEQQSASRSYFNGNIYLLINGGTYSAASLLAVALKTQINCIVLGDEAGGGMYGTDGAMIPTIVLPNTHLQLRLPLLWTYSMAQGKNDGQGLKPDITLLPDDKELYNEAFFHIDPAIAALKKLINFEGVNK